MFPEFLETCRDHVRDHDGLVLSDFENFEQKCLQQDGLALVEYATMLQAAGCILNLMGVGGAGHRRLMGKLLRRVQQQVGLGQRLGVSGATCSWDEMDDIAHDVDSCVHTSHLLNLSLLTN